MMKLGWSFDATTIEVDQIASVVCDCEILVVPQLSERTVFRILESEYQVDCSDAVPTTDAALAGALCVATNGSFRWIFVRAEDSPERRRFTVAHELGHLFLDALPELESAAASLSATDMPFSRSAELRIFSRCSETESLAKLPFPRQAQSALTDNLLKEIRAHHFAAELLMPYESVARFVGKLTRLQDIETEQHRDRLVTVLARHYRVSFAAAKLRVEKDLGITPRQDDPNRDLFE
jgi:Zn-dependent peptidase ImmA (M78 family)